MYRHSHRLTPRVRARRWLLAALACLTAIVVCATATVASAQVRVFEDNQREPTWQTSQAARTSSAEATDAAMLASGAGARDSSTPSSEAIFGYFYPGQGAPAGDAANELAAQMLFWAAWGSTAISYLPRPGVTMPGAAWLATQAALIAYRTLVQGGIYDMVRNVVALAYRSRFELLKAEASAERDSNDTTVPTGDNVASPDGTEDGDTACCVYPGPLIVEPPADSSGEGEPGGTNGHVESSETSDADFGGGGDYGDYADFGVQGGGRNEEFLVMGD